LTPLAVASLRAAKRRLPIRDRAASAGDVAVHAASRPLLDFARLRLAARGQAPLADS
jgi:hypothetical protein